MNEFIRFEALHTTNIIVEMIDDHLMRHQYYDSNVNPEYNKLVDEAQALLARAYQVCGQDDEESNNDSN